MMEPFIRCENANSDGRVSCAQSCTTSKKKGAGFSLRCCSAKFRSFCPLVV